MCLTQLSSTFLLFLMGRIFITWKNSQQKKNTKERERKRNNFIFAMLTCSAAVLFW